MTRNAYVDESQRRSGYAVAAVSIEHRSVAEVRHALREMAPDGRSRRHFVKESDKTRRQMLKVFRDLPGCSTDVVVTTARGSVVEQRARCLGALAVTIMANGLDRLVLDHVEPTQQRRDRQTLAPVLGRTATYAHELEHSAEPMLWIPDAVAWCVGRRGWFRELDGWVIVQSC